MVYLGHLTHFAHKNICRGTTEWKELEPGSSHQNTRDFDTLDKMNYALIKGINDNVGVDDELWHIGDWSFAGVQNIWNFRKQLNCKNIHLVFGNHDHHQEKDSLFDLSNTFEERAKYVDLTNNKGEFVGIDNSNIRARVTPLFKSVQYYKELSIEGHKICLLHYGMRVWNHSHKNSIHLYGHSHDTLPSLGKSMDVGVDVAFRLFGEYRPFSWQEIQSIMSKRSTEIVDHHNFSTN